MERNLGSYLSSSNERTNTIKRNVAYSTIIRGINILISLILVPLTINYVSSELYGIWLSLSSIVTWFSFFDIGFGLGLRNRLTFALALKKYKYGKILVSSTYAFMSIIFLVIGVSACIGCMYVDWVYLLNILPENNEEVTLSFQIVIIAFCVRMVLQIVTNVCQAYQMTALASAIDMVGNLLSLLFMVILVYTVAPSLVHLSAALCLAPFIALLFTNIVLYRGRFRAVSPSLLCVRSFVLGDITSLGAKFFLIQIICVILYQTTNFVISHFCGPEQVTVYNIAYKYLNIAIMIFSIIQSPIWSAFNDAYAKNDYSWMRDIYRKLVRIIVLSELFLLVLVSISPYVYYIWIGDSVDIPFHITVLLAIYTGTLLINNMHAMIINGMGILKLQTIIAWLQGIVFVPIVYFLAISYKMEGILIALIIVTFFPCYFLIKQVRALLNQTAKGIYSK